jgi:eukaryotic-like serine/threonine-protein kinase
MFPELFGLGGMMAPVLMQTVQRIDLVEGAGYGTSVGTFLLWVGGSIALITLAAVAVGIARWVKANYLKTAVAPIMVVARETRERVQAALEAGDYELAGDLLGRSGALDEAAETYLRGEAYAKAAAMYQSTGYPAQAIYCFKKAGDHRQAARIYEQQGRHRGAAVEYWLANDLALSAAQYEAAQDFRRAAENYERSGEYLRAGSCFERAGQDSKAAELYARFFEGRLRLASGLDDVEEHRDKALRAGELFKAAGDLVRAADVFEKGGYFKEAAEALQEQGDHAAAAELLLKANEPLLAAKILEEGGEKKRASLMRAEAALSDGRKAEAASLFAAAGEMEKAAGLYAESGQPEPAAELYEKLGQHLRAMELYLEVPKYAHAARCAEAGGQLARAAELYQEAGDVEGQLRVLSAQGDFFRAGRLQFEHRQFEEALKTLEQIDSRDGMYARSLELQGDILRAQGRAEKAYSKYRAALGNRNAEQATLPLFYKMGRALEEEPDLTGAMECYSAIVAVEPHFEDVELRLKGIRQRLRRGSATGTTGSGLFSRSEASVDGASRRYEIVEEVARGGMGIVYKAKDTVLDRVVAFKILGENLRDNEMAVKYFLREARAAAALSHPNIVTIYDAGEQDGEYYMAMEFVEGTTLKELVRRAGALADDKVRYILLNCARALDYAHSKGIIHRDIKSGNVMTTRDKALKVMDFGLAKFLSEYQNNHTQQVGTPFYMSPEQIIGKDIDFRSDLYSLGCMIFECATGVVPFFKGDLSYHHLHTPPPAPRSLNPGLSVQMEKIILKLLEKEPARRFQSAREVLELLE